MEWALKNAGHDMAIVGEPCNVDAHAKMPGLFQAVFRQMSSSVKGHFPSNVVFHQRRYSVKGRLPSKVVFCQWSSSVNGLLPSKVIFH